MSEFVNIAFAGLAAPKAGVLVAFVDGDLPLGGAAGAILAPVASTIAAAAEFAGFKGKTMTALDILAPAGLAAGRLVVVGVAPGKDGKRLDFVQLGGFVVGKLGKAKAATALFSGPGEEGWTPEAAADFALGARLRAYKFDKYKSKKPDDEESDGEPLALTIGVADADAALAAYASREAVAEGVEIARTLVNEPANVIFPDSFVERASALKKLGVGIEVLDEKEMEKLGMGALTAVGRGSARGARLMALRWRGVKGKKTPPLAIVGKGVCFDSGGLSIKPAAGMEDMKGDMAGAACVVGLIHALATRKAKVHVVGVVGLVENMPDGTAYRPGDILTSASGQTIEVLNTDAEGRLVLADALWWAREHVKPKLIVDLATLTGAILVALGHEHAGLFATDDELAERLTAAGKATGELVWRLPLGAAYDKLIDSKIADMKNTGGRHGGSITAAQFLKRFVGDTPWAHLDIAGTAMASPSTEINPSWGSGWGVRLLDRWIAEHYEER